jgi:hypothetical protein
MCLSRSNCQQLDFIEKNGDVERRKDDEDITISLSGKYEFIATLDVIKGMEEERKLNVVWAYDDKKVKEGPKYKLSQESVRVLHRKLRSSALGEHVNGFTKAVITSRTGNETSFMHIHGFRETNGMIGLLCISKSRLSKAISLKVMILLKSLDSSRLMEKEKLSFSVA